MKTKGKMVGRKDSRADQGRWNKGRWDKDGMDRDLPHGRFASLAGPWALIFSLLAVTFPVFDVDLYWHLANGRAMRLLGGIVNEEVLSFTHPGVPFVNHEWLAQWMFFGLWDRWGWAGLMGLKLLLVALVVALLFRTARLEGAAPWNAALVTCVAVMAGFFRFHVRPELFSLAGLALLQFLLLRHRRRPTGSLLWSLPVLFLVWDWLHGAAIGWLYLAGFALFMNVRRFYPGKNRETPCSRALLKTLNPAGLATVAVSLINPYGLRSYGHFWTLATGAHGADRILELQPVWRNPGDHLLLLLVLILVVLKLVFRPRHQEGVLSFLAAIFVVAAIRYLRFAEMSLIVLVPFVAQLMSGRPQPSRRGLRRDRVGLALAGVWLVLGLVFLQEKVLAARGTVSAGGTYVLPSQTAWGWGTNDFLIPRGTADFVRRHGLAGEYYNNANLGGYLAFALGPERKIFQFNMPPIFGDVTAMMNNPAAFASYGLDLGFAGDPGEFRQLFSQEDWACVYNDYVSSLMVRRVPRFQGIIQRYEVRHFRTLEQLARDPAVRKRLVFEMTVYLECMPDERVREILDRIVARYPGG
ncbi:hypothetical protein CSA17_00505 [bacterium DOLJORAL78_65_58]|nr:MAG: hypothetical protein CSA17_00505 [bacterium DOLJORAL78_65_58]